MPGLNPSADDLAQFCAITQASTEEATHFLEAGTTLEGAIEDFFAAQNAATERPAGLAEDVGIPYEAPEESESTHLLSDQSSPETTINMSDQTDQPQAGSTGGPRTLGGQAADEPLPEGWGRPERRTGRVGEWSAGRGGGRAGDGARTGGIATLGSMGGSSGGPPIPQGDDDDDFEDEDEDPERRGQDMYAGGERSGLAIQNPDDPRRGPQGIVKDILRQAASAGPRPESATRPRNSAFTGAGNTLGSDETPSSSVPDPSAPSAPSTAPAGSGSAGSAPGGLLGALLGRAGFGGAPTSANQPESDDWDPEGTAQTRRLTFWRDGFSIEDGPLHRYDAPGNRELLEMIQSGRAPPSLFGVKYNQPLQLEVAQRTQEEYQEPPKGPMKAFSGGGNRLGSATPDVEGAGSSGAGGAGVSGIMVGGSSGTGGGGAGSAAGAGPGASTAGDTTGGASSFKVDESKPTTSIQIRLADGTKLVAKVNLTHQVRDLVSYVRAARPGTQNFVLQTTFPSKELSDMDATVEGAGLKNAVVVQRYT